MKKVLALAAREVADRRMILMTAVVLAGLPFAALLIPEAVRFGTGRVIATTAAATATVYCFALVFLLGGSFVVRELTDKRMSFYFSKPLTGTTIWFGKLAGTWATILASVAIILIPAILATGDRWLRNREAIAFFAAGMVGWFLIAHASSTMVRSRSPLLLADAAAVVISWYVVYRIVRALDAGHAKLLIGWFLFSVLALLVIILTAAGAWQLSRGRIDIRANHRELSRFLWSAMAVMLAIAAAVAMWIVSVGPEDLTGETLSLDQPATGNWIRIGGPTQHRGDYHAVFFVNLSNGAHVRADGQTLWRDGFFTRDGRAGGQLRRVRGEQNLELDLIRFNEDAVQIVPTNVDLEPNATLMPSDDAGQLVVMSGNMVLVQSLPRGDVRASAQLPVRPKEARYFFVTPDLVRIYADLFDRKEIFELDVRTKKLTRTGQVKGPAMFNANADGSRLFVRDLEARESYVADARTGERITTVPDQQGVILSDARLASVPVRNGEKAVTVGGMTVPVPHIQDVVMFRELSGNRLLVGGAVDRKKSAWTIHVVDLNAGKVVRTERALRPIDWDFFNYTGRDPRHSVAPADAPVLMIEGDSVIGWVPATGAKRAVIAGL